MNKSEKATARPWKMNVTKLGHIISVSPENDISKHCFAPMIAERDEDLANAELIVKAVNNFDQLLEACKEVKDLFDHGYLHELKGFRNGIALIKLEQAIKQAEG